MYVGGQLKRVASLVLLIAVVSALAGAGAAWIAHSGGPADPPGAGYWHTSGTNIVDAHGQTVRLAGVTWYGMETSYWVPAGLDYQRYMRIMDLVKELGYNSIRLPFSNELVETNPIVEQHINANPQFRGLHALQVMDAIVQYAGRIGLKIILDDHVSQAERPKTVNDLTEALWYAPGYPESSWIQDWVTLARRYLGNDAVIGFDLRNEPHTNGPGPWNLNAYLHQGSTWGPYNGIDEPATDWRSAAERAGNAILAVNSHLLVFVEGLQLYPDAGAPDGVSSYWWGSILAPVRQYPVEFRVHHQLVYSAHDWGPLKWSMAWFPHMSYASMQTIWHKMWSFVVDDSSRPLTAPLWIGEFGTCTNTAQCLDQVKQGNQAQWFHLFLRFLQAHSNVGWSFFALNGTNANDHAASNGLLNAHWDGVANAALQSDLSRIQR